MDRTNSTDRHVAGDAGDCRRSFADDAVLAELVGRELAGGWIVANLIRADDEGAAVLVPDDQMLGSGASWHGTDNDIVDERLHEYERFDSIFDHFYHDQ